MSKNKLSPAKEWFNRPINTWTVLSFTEYLKAAHKVRFGIDYAPFGGTWSMEQGILGDLIGTSSRTNPKPRTASNASVKRFIDETFADYQPNAKYPGTSFGFMFTYRKNVWQAIQADEVAEARRQEREQAIEDVDYAKLDDWL